MALRGVKVIELAGLAPVPFCGMILSDFGAEVVRIDKVGSPHTFDKLDNGKKSISLNLKHPEGVSILRKLATGSDVLIEPFRAGVMEKLGLGPDVLLKDNPRLIYARLTGYGQTGPMKNAAGHDINYIGLSGLLSRFGRKHEKPIFPVNFTADFGGGGLVCALGIALALFEREKSGLGQVIDTSMAEGAAYVGSFLYKIQDHPIWGKPRGENILDSGAHFYEVYETKDGKYVTVGALEPQFYDNLLKGLELTEDEAPQFGDFDEIKLIFEKVFKTKTRDEWWEIFKNVDACVGPVLELDEAPNHEHNKERKSFDENQFPRPAPILSRTPARSLQKSPLVGEHTLEVLQEAGFENNKIQEFLEQGIVEQRAKPKL